MTDLPQRMVEAAARAIYHANLREEASPWDVLVATCSDKPGTLGYRALDRCRTQARAALRAALALAEAEGVVLVRVPGERPLARHRQPGETVEHDVGYNSCRAATLAGRVEV